MQITLAKQLLADVRDNSRDHYVMHDDGLALLMYAANDGCTKVEIQMAESGEYVEVGTRTLEYVGPRDEMDRKAGVTPAGDAAMRTAPRPSRPPTLTAAQRRELSAIRECGELYIRMDDRDLNIWRALERMGLIRPVAMSEHGITYAAVRPS